MENHRLRMQEHYEYFKLKRKSGYGIQQLLNMHHKWNQSYKNKIFNLDELTKDPVLQRSVDNFVKSAFFDIFQSNDESLGQNKVTNDGSHNKETVIHLNEINNKKLLSGRDNCLKSVKENNRIFINSDRSKYDIQSHINHQHSINSKCSMKKVLKSCVKKDSSNSLKKTRQDISSKLEQGIKNSNEDTNLKQTQNLSKSVTFKGISSNDCEKIKVDHLHAQSDSLLRPLLENKIQFSLHTNYNTDNISVLNSKPSSSSSANTINQSFYQNQKATDRKDNKITISLNKKEKENIGAPLPSYNATQRGLSIPSNENIVQSQLSTPIQDANYCSFASGFQPVDCFAKNALSNVPTPFQEFHNKYFPYQYDNDMSYWDHQTKLLWDNLNVFVPGSYAETEFEGAPHAEEPYETYYGPGFRLSNTNILGAPMPKTLVPLDITNTNDT